MKDDGQDTGPDEKIRIDKWLWQARFLKTRSLAARLVSEGHVRINSTRVTKPAHAVRPGDVLTFPQGNAIRVVRLLAIGLRRGPASEAQTLYEDLTPARDSAPDEAARAPRFEGKGRPTKRDRRKLDQGRSSALD